MFFPSDWLFSHITTDKSMDSVERGVNPVAMTINNPRKNTGRAGDRTSDLLFSSPVRHRLSYTSKAIKEMEGQVQNILLVLIC